jgi:hypothetical protein
MSAWLKVRYLIKEKMTKALADRVLSLDDAERAEVAKQLPGYLKELQTAAVETATARLTRTHSLTDANDPWMRREARRESLDDLREYGPALLVAGAGTIAGPSAATAWLTRRDLLPTPVWRWDPVPAPDRHLLRVIASRPAEWQAEVTRRIAAKVRGADDRTITPLAFALLRSTGAEPPQHEPLVLAWLSAGLSDDWRPGGVSGDRRLGAVSADDPLTPALLPRIFETEGAGRLLRDERISPAPSQMFALIGELLAEGALAREELLDGCVSRFLRGGDATALRFFVRLHTMLDPSPEESAGRARDYLRLLPAAPGPVADLALAQLRRTGPHDAADVAEGVEALVFRAEIKLARAGLAWLDQHVRRTPADAPDLAPALATAFGHANHDIQERAAKLAVKHQAALGPVADVLADAVPLLPADLGPQVSAIFGGETTAAGPGFALATLPDVAAPDPFPVPEPRAEFWPRFQEELWHLHDPVPIEQWLAAFVEDATENRPALRAALEPYSGYSTYGHWDGNTDWVVTLAKELGDPGSLTASENAAQPVPSPASENLTQAIGPIVKKVTTYLLGDAESEDGSRLPLTGIITQTITNFQNLLSPHSDGAEQGHPVEERPAPPAAPRLPARRSVSAAQMLRLRRLHEVYTALKAERLPPVLLATPTLITGCLDPIVLVERLERCAVAGVEPLPADLQQALLRLPRGARPDLAERAAKVDLIAAAAVADWLAEGGMADPETGLEWHLKDSYYQSNAHIVPVLVARPTGHRYIDELLRHPSEQPSHDGENWSLTLPSHREVVAVNLLRNVGTYAWQPGSELVVALADGDGQVGEATALVLAAALCGKESGALTALLRMAAKGELPAEAIGRHLALLLRHTDRKVRPALAILSEAAEQGAHEQVWTIMRALLPGFLPGEGERPNVNHSEVIAFAADVAVRTGARGEIPEVTAHAARGRSSRFGRECVRLRDQLSAPAAG